MPLIRLTNIKPTNTLNGDSTMFLTHKVAVYVPATINGDQPSPAMQAAWTDRMLVGLSKAFGGATVIDGQGAWVSDQLGLVKEPVKIVYAFTDAETYDLRLSDVLGLAEAMRAEMGQEAVAVEVDGGLRLLSAPSKIRVAS